MKGNSQLSIDVMAVVCFIPVGKPKYMQGLDSDDDSEIQVNRKRTSVHSSEMKQGIGHIISF